jgi:hypothetical protein
VTMAPKGILVAIRAGSGAGVRPELSCDGPDPVRDGICKGFRAEPPALGSAARFSDRSGGAALPDFPAKGDLGFPTSDSFVRVVFFAGNDPGLRGFAIPH